MNPNEVNVDMMLTVVNEVEAQCHMAIYEVLFDLQKQEYPK